jgi:hypothetical protein
LADDGSTCDASSTTLNGTLRYHETTFEGRTPDGWQPLGRTAFAAQGGTVTEAGGYRIHTFTSNGNLEVISDAGTVEVLVVGGGAGGGGRSGGGGGAGGLVYTSAIGVGAYQNITVQIGNGGSGGATSDSPGNDGANSSFGVLIAIGGGGGGADSSGQNGRAGVNGTGGGGGGAASPGGNGGYGGRGGYGIVIVRYPIP